MPHRDSDASSLSPDTELADRLHSAAIHLLRRLRREDDATGVSAPRLSALSVVVFGGPLTLGELARAEQVKPPTMSRIIQGLEASGYVRRQPHPSDRRAVLLLPTPKGRSVLQKGRRRRLAALEKQLSGLSHDERESLAEAVEILERMLCLAPCDRDE